MGLGLQIEDVRVEEGEVLGEGRAGGGLGVHRWDNRGGLDRVDRGSALFGGGF